MDLSGLQKLEGKEIRASRFRDGLSPSEVDVGRGQIIDVLVIAVVVVVIHEGFNAGLKI